MRSIHNTQRGQVLIIFVFAIMGLVGMTGLAIDGANAFSDRRHAQSAADTAALTAALTRANWLVANPGGNCYGFHTAPSAVLPANSCDAVNQALNMAGKNGYANGSSGTAAVDVYSPPIDGYYATCSNGDCDPNNYIEVVIKTDVNTWFARVLGIGQMHNTVQAIALSDAAHKDSPFGNYAIVGLNPGLSGPHDLSFQAQSNALTVTINGGGIFANGTAQDVHSTVTINGVSGACVTAVDSATGFACGGSSPNPALEVQYPASVLKLLPPIPQCLGNATVASGDIVHPDADATKSATGSKVNGFDHKQYLPGLYCVRSIGGNTTTSLDITGTGVTFYMMDSSFGFKFKSNAGSLSASAPVADHSVPWTETYAGVLMFSNVTTPNPYGGGTCPQQLDLRGSSSTPVVGTIMLPGACITWLGNSGAAAQTKLIGWDVYLSGNANATFNYSSSDQYKVSYPGQVGIMH